MYWSTVNFSILVEMLLPTFLRKSRMLAILRSYIAPMTRIHREVLYTMQHDGRTIYLEKVLNEWFAVPGYSPQNHTATKKVYIDDIPESDKLYIFQDEENETLFLEDELDTEDDVFLDGNNENNVTYSWIIYVPSSYTFNEIQLRALVDSYRYYGKKYAIQTY